uniref:Uncharacterized protein n=1 Tax=Anguilla anguilla TaxID=7936 RepID=A0A0E9XUX0_ANGAN
MAIAALSLLKTRKVIKPAVNCSLVSGPYSLVVVSAFPKSYTIGTVGPLLVLHLPALYLTG